MLKFYDEKNNKKALEIADRLLQAYPEHIEVMSFKAMTLNQAKNFTQAEFWINKALKKDFTAFFGWHVMGIIKKSTKDYEGARSAYLQAYKLG